MELNSSEQRSELFGWIDSLGGEFDCQSDEHHETSNLFENFGRATVKPKSSIEDNLIDDYVSGSLRGRFQKVRLIMVFLGERIFDYLNEGDLFKLMEVDDFIGGKAMSYKLFSKPQSNHHAIGWNQNSFLTDVSTASNPKLEAEPKTIMPKTEQAMLRIRKTNVILNRPDSRKASIVSGKETPALSAGFSASSVSQLTRPDTAESLTSSRPRLAPIAAAARPLNPKPHLTIQPPSKSLHPLPLTQKGPPPPSQQPTPLPKPQTPSTPTRLFSLPFGATQQLHKQPDTAAAHAQRFAEAAQRRMLQGWGLCLGGGLSVAAAVEECVCAAEDVQMQAREVVSVFGGTEKGGRFIEAVEKCRVVGKAFEGVRVGKELQGLEEHGVKGSGVKDVVSWCQTVLETASTQFSGDDLPQKLVLAFYSVKIYSQLRLECDKNNHLAISNLASNSNSRWFSRKVPIILSQAGKNIVRFQSGIEAASILAPLSQQVAKHLTGLRQLFEVSKSFGRLLGAGDEGLRALIQVVGSSQSSGKYWTEEGTKIWTPIKDAIEKEIETLRKAGKLGKEG